MNRGNFISKEESVMLQGIAVCLMVVHHLLGFPERINVEYCNLLDFSFFHFETILGYFGRICIALFAFISGYGIMKKMDRPYSSSQEVLKRGYNIAIKQLKKFYLLYWLVFVVFVPYGLITHVYSFEFWQFVKNFLGLASSYNAEWWYVSYYLRMMLLFPIVYWMAWNIKRLINEKGIVLLAGIGLSICLFGNMLPWHSFFCLFYCFLLGSLAVYCDFYEHIYYSIQNNIIGYGLVFVIVGGAVFVRAFISQSIDYLIAPILVLGFVLILKFNIKIPLVKSVLRTIGSYSTYIWLTHTFFAYYYWQSYLYRLRYSMLIVGVCILLCILVGRVLEIIRSYFAKVI